MVQPGSLALDGSSEGTLRADEAVEQHTARTVSVEFRTERLHADDLLAARVRTLADKPRAGAALPVHSHSRAEGSPLVDS